MKYINEVNYTPLEHLSVYLKIVLIQCTLHKMYESINFVLVHKVGVLVLSM